VQARVAGELRGQVVDRHRRPVELDEAVVEAGRLAGLGELVGEQGVGDQALVRPATGRRAERVGDLVAPGEGAALVAALVRRAHEGDPDIVDRQRVLLERAGGLRGADQLAPRLGASGDRLDRLYALRGQVPARARPATWR
jgi:hypothetical protein